MSSKLSKHEEKVRLAVASVQASGQPVTVHAVARAANRQGDENHVFGDLERLVHGGHLTKADSCYRLL